MIEENQNKKTTKNIWPILIFLIVVFVLIAGILIYFQYQKNTKEKSTNPLPFQPAETTEDDTSEKILNEIEGINIDDLDKQFQEIDTDLNSL